MYFVYVFCVLAGGGHGTRRRPRRFVSMAEAHQVFRCRDRCVFLWYIPGDYHTNYYVATKSPTLSKGRPWTFFANEFTRGTSVRGRTLASARRVAERVVVLKRLCRECVFR